MYKDFEVIEVNDKKYRVRLMSVMQTISFHLQFMSAGGGAIANAVAAVKKYKDISNLPDNFFPDLFASLPADKAEKMIGNILAQVVPPDNVQLEGEMAVQTWFARDGNPGDLYEVIGKAGVILLGEYLPNSLRTLIQSMKSAAVDAVLKFQESSGESASQVDQSPEG